MGVKPCGPAAVHTRTAMSSEPVDEPAVDEHAATERPAVDQPAVGEPAADQPTVGELTEQLARTQAERDDAVKALDREGRRARRKRKLRRGFVGVIVVLFSILLPLTFTITWAHYTVLNTNGWVNTVGPLTSNPAVADALGTTVTNELFTSLNAQQQIAGVLPPRASFLAGPITSGVKGYVQNAVTKVVGSPQFNTIWRQANRFAHQQLVNVLQGKSKALSTTNGQVVLNLVPLVNAALANMQPFVSGLVGHNVTLPTISPSDIPKDACQRIGSAIGRTLPSNCGQIALFPADKLKQAQRLVRVFNRVTILLLVVTPVLAAIALWVSRRRRRTLLQLSIGGILGLVIFRRVIIYLEHTLANSGDPANKAARQAIMSQVFHVYFDISTWLLIGLAVVVVVAAVTGPYRWAVAIRRVAARLGRGGANLVRATAAQAGSDATTGWVRSHLDLMRVAGIALAVILLLALPIGWVGALVIVVLLALYELWLQRFKRATPEDTSTTPPPAATVGGPSATEPS